MKTALKQEIIRLTSLFMIGLMLMLVVNKAVFTHTHKLKDGTLVEHAHPYNKSGDKAPLKSHHHSTIGFFFYQHLPLLFFIAIATLVIATANECKTITTYQVLKPVLVQLKLNIGRAPPLS